jgi:hypothetical protein
MKPHCIWAVLVLAGCVSTESTPQTSLEIQALQSKEFEAPKPMVFEATLSVLQDAGYIIESADVASGFITGKAPTRSNLDFWKGPMNKGGKVTAIIIPLGETHARVRLNFVASSQRKSVWNPSQDVINETPVMDPELYQRVFAKIGETIFVIKGTK